MPTPMQIRTNLPNSRRPECPESATTAPAPAVVAPTPPATNAPTPAASLPAPSNAADTTLRSNHSNEEEVEINAGAGAQDNGSVAAPAPSAARKQKKLTNAEFKEMHTGGVSDPAPILTRIVTIKQQITAAEARGDTASRDRLCDESTHGAGSILRHSTVCVCHCISTDPSIFDFSRTVATILGAADDTLNVLHAKDTAFPAVLDDYEKKKHEADRKFALATQTRL